MSSLKTPSPTLCGLPRNEQLLGVRRSLFATKNQSTTEMTPSCPPAPKPRMCHPLTTSLFPQELNVKENDALNLVFLPDIADTDAEKGLALRRHRPRRPLMPTLRDLAPAQQKIRRAPMAPSAIKLNRRPRNQFSSEKQRKLHSAALPLF